MNVLVSPELATLGPLAMLVLVPAVGYVIASIGAGVAASRRRRDAAGGEEADILDPTLHPAVVGVIANDQHFGAENAQNSGLFDEAAAALISMAGQGKVELDWNGDRADTAETAEASPKTPYRYRFIGEPARAIDAAARGMLDPAQDGSWVSLDDYEASDYAASPRFASARTELDQALFAEAIDRGLFERAGKLQAFLAGPIAYVVEAWTVIAGTLALGFATAAIACIVVMFSRSAILVDETKLTPRGIAVRNASIQLRTWAIEYATGQLCPEDPQTVARKIEVLAAMGCANGLRNVIEIIADFQKGSSKRVEEGSAAGRVLRWCEARKTSYPVEVSALTALVGAGERARESEQE